jgi:hypothetical protein
MAKILIVLPERKKLASGKSIPSLRQFFFLNGNPNGFLNAISIRPYKELQERFNFETNRDNPLESIWNQYY